MIALGVILVPLPPMLMDLLISVNISLAIVVLLTTIYMTKPLDFSVFPSLLLATTLLRLVLNIASTRLILTADADQPRGRRGCCRQGDPAPSATSSRATRSPVGVDALSDPRARAVPRDHQGRDARVPRSPRGSRSTRCPASSSRSTPTSTPACLSEEEARDRREEIRQEADFFGAMDGASKFVRGDAIAGIIITVINVLGGFAVGTLERGWPAGQTAEVFTRLTIGDGLTSAIPSFVISIAAALIVTRSGSKADLGTELTTSSRRSRAG
jgi:flagellar biosynthesis protein FlhA